LGAPLKIISAFPPTLEYSESPKGLGGSASSVTSVILPEGAKVDLMVYSGLMIMKRIGLCK
jgi:hypothetical protein